MNKRIYITCGRIPKNMGQKKLLRRYNNAFEELIEIVAYCYPTDCIGTVIQPNLIKRKKVYDKIVKKSLELAHNTDSISRNEIKSIAHYNSKVRKISKRFAFLIFTILSIIEENKASLSSSGHLDKLNINLFVNEYIMSVFSACLPHQPYLDKKLLLETTTYYNDQNRLFRVYIANNTLSDMKTTDDWLIDLKFNKFDRSKLILK